MNTNNEDVLKKELEEFKKEKEKIRKLVGAIGGKNSSKFEKIINIAFLILMLILFILELGFSIIPATVSLEIGILLVSIKIIWMIHSQSKVNHFQFWILNSIEFRINDISKKISNIEKEIEKTK